MAGWPVKKNASKRIAFPIYDADGDLVTGQTCDSEFSYSDSDGAFSTFTDCTNEASEIATSSGVYELLVAQSELNHDVTVVITKSGSGKTAVNELFTSTRQIDDLAYPATSGRSIQVETDGHVHADLKEWLGVAPAALASTYVQIDLQTWKGSAPNNLAGNLVQTSVGEMGTNVITAGAIQADAITAAKVAADVHAEAADAVWDEDIEAAHGGDASAGLLLRALGADITNRTNTQTLHGLLGIPDASGEDIGSEVADEVWDELRSGHVGAGSFGQGVASVQGDVTGNVDGTVASVVGNVGGNVVGTVASVVGAVGSVTGDVGGNVTGSVGSVATGGIVAASFASGAIDAAAIAANAITDAKINAGAITAAKFAANAITSTVVADDFITAAKIATDALAADGLAADALNEIADTVYSRDIDQVEGTMPVHCLGTAVLKAVSRIRDNSGTLEVYRTNGTTIHMSQTITVDSGLDPIDELTVGS